MNTNTIDTYSLLRARKKAIINLKQKENTIIVLKNLIQNAQKENYPMEIIKDYENSLIKATKEYTKYFDFYKLQNLIKGGE